MAQFWKYSLSVLTSLGRVCIYHGKQEVEGWVLEENTMKEAKVKQRFLCLDQERWGTVTQSSTQKVFMAAENRLGLGKSKCIDTEWYQERYQLHGKGIFRHKGWNHSKCVSLIFWLHWPDPVRKQRRFQVLPALTKSLLKHRPYGLDSECFKTKLY